MCSTQLITFQIEKIVTTVSLPPTQSVSEMCSEYAQSILEKARTMKRRSLSEVLSGSSSDAIQVAPSLTVVKAGQS